MALKDLVVRGPKPPMPERRFAPDGRGRTPRLRPKYSHDPQHISEHTWYYEEPNGLLIVHEIRASDGHYIRTDQFTIPWRSVMKSVRHHIPIRDIRNNL